MGHPEEASQDSMNLDWFGEFGNSCSGEDAGGERRTERQLSKSHLSTHQSPLTIQSSCFCSYQKGLFKTQLGSVLLCVTDEAINHSDY